MRFRRVLLALIFVIALMLSTVSCALESGNTQNTDKNATGNKSVSNRKSLQIYVYNGDDFLMRAIGEYNSQYTDVPIEIVEFQTSEIEKCRNQISVSLLAGGGPDILYFYDDLYPFKYKIMKNKILCNLDEIIMQDSEFNLDEYNKKIIDGVIFEGKRYFIPLGYTLPLLWTTEDILQNNSININGSEWTWKNAGKIVNEYLEKNDKGKKYFFAYYFELRRILRSCTPNLIDYTKKKTYFDTPEFIELLKVFREIKPSICTEEDMIKYNGQYTTLIKNNDLIMVNGSFTLSGNKLWLNNSIITSLLESKMELFPYPSYTAGKRVSVELDCLIGINSACKYKKEAFRLIKIALSKDFLMSFEYYPLLNDQVFEEYTAKYSSANEAGKELHSPIGDYVSVSLPASLIKEYKNIIENMGDSYLMDDGVLDIIENEMQQYFDNKVSAEKAAKNIDAKVMLYLNE